jgi:hypothetical protein
MVHGERSQEVQQFSSAVVDLILAAKVTTHSIPD